MNALRTVACASVIAGLTTFAFAQQGKPEPSAKPAQTGQPSQTGAGTGQTGASQRETPRMLRAGNEVVGGVIVTPNSEQLGRIEEIVIHPRGDIAYVQVAGGASAGSQHFPVPWRAFTRNAQGQLVLNTTAQSFASMPGYETRPALTDTAYWGTVDRAWSKTVSERNASATERGTATEASAPMTSLVPAKTLYTGSDFKTRTIETAEGEKIATVREIVVDPRMGRVSYVVLALNDASGANGRVIAVPWEVLRTMPDRADPKTDRWTLSVPREKLASAPEFAVTSEGWTTASSPEYVRRVFEYYSTPPYWPQDQRWQGGGDTRTPPGQTKPAGDTKNPDEPKEPKR